MHFGRPDRVPLYELGLWGQTAEQFVKEGMPEEQASADFFTGEGFPELDPRSFVPINVGLLPAFEHCTLEEDERYVVYRDNWGRVHKALKEGTVRGTRLCMDQYVRFTVETPDDWKQVKKRLDPSTPGRYPDNWEELKAKWQTRDHPLCLLTNGTFGFYSMARRLMGTENLSYAWYDYPAMMHEMMETFADFFIETVHRALDELEVDYFNFFEDMAGKGGPLISPAQFREFILPGYRRVCNFLREHGVEIIWVDSDGDTRPLIPLWLEAGVTCHWPLEVAAGMDPVELRKQYGTDLALVGGIDKRELAGGRKAIEAELMKKLPFLLETGGYIPTVDHTVQPGVPYRDFMYYLELKRKIVEGR